MSTCFYKRHRACLSALAKGLSWTAPSLRRVRDCRNGAVKHPRVPVLHPAAGFVACSVGCSLDLSGHRQPRGVHPIGGRNGNPMEAQRSGFHWERTSDEMSEPCPFKGEANDMQSARTRLVVSRGWGFNQGEIEIPLPLDGSLVTFCPHRKSLARRRNILSPVPPAGETISPLQYTATRNQMCLHSKIKTPSILHFIKYQAF